MDHAGGAWCGADALTFRLGDVDRHLAGVRLSQHAGVPSDQLDFSYDDEDRAWHLRVARPAFWRLEYQLELHHHDGGTELICDPDNPKRVGGAFGDKSVVECDDYAEPGWLHQPGAEGTWRELSIRAPAVKAEVWARIWSPHTRTDRVLVAHDGPEYDKFASLGQYSAAMIATGRVPPHHLVLLAPGDRSEWYAASPGYAWALAADIMPRLFTELDTARSVVGMGASLGGLAMLHAQRRYPDAFEGLFLQSASFFRPEYDRHESWFKRYLRIVRFTGRAIGGADVSGTGAGPRPVPVILTCGRVEENLANNRAMTRSLWRQGYPAALYEVPDAHNYTGWRDAFDPYLTDLLHRVWKDN
jgi:enterochelin esterase family protein